MLARIRRLLSHLDTTVATVATVERDSCDATHTQFTKPHRVSDVKTIVQRLRTLCPYTEDEATIVRVDPPGSLTFDVSLSPSRSDVKGELARSFWTVHRYSATHSTASVVVDLSELTWSLLGRLLEYDDAHILTGIDIFRSLGPPVEHVHVVPPRAMRGFGLVMMVARTAMSRKLRARMTVARTLS